ncbi:MAG TPA: type II toxin-antitoxin system VapC family toxin [Pirellulaceae bacterium]|nr:type II toxin-antitoxin system VapC family toxin [Pirellulaceae bacterium]
MNGEFLLDTSAVIAILRGWEGAAERFKDADRISINATVLGELYYGALRSPRVEDSLQRIETFLDSVAIRRCTENTARHYARIKAELQSQGLPIPENDLWIAATAVQHNLTLVARDEHFDRIANLRKERW